MTKQPYLKPENHQPHTYLKQHRKMEIDSIWIEIGFVAAAITFVMIVVLALVCTCCDPGAL